MKIPTQMNMILCTNGKVTVQELILLSGRVPKAVFCFVCNNLPILDFVVLFLNSGGWEDVQCVLVFVFAKNSYFNELPVQNLKHENENISKLWIMLVVEIMNEKRANKNAMKLKTRKQQIKCSHYIQGICPLFRCNMEPSFTFSIFQRCSTWSHKPFVVLAIGFYENRQSYLLSNFKFPGTRGCNFD